jgi:hypothetical protein
VLGSIARDRHRRLLQRLSSYLVSEPDAPAGAPGPRP